MKQFINIFNHQYQIDDIKIKTIMNETHERFIQQIFKIVIRILRSNDQMI